MPLPSSAVTPVDAAAIATAATTSARVHGEHHIHSDRLRLGRRLRGRCVGPAKFDGKWCPGAIAAEWLRGFAVAAIQQLLDGSDAGGFCFGSTVDEAERITI
jgi:hypothetical protein